MLRCHCGAGARALVNQGGGAPPPWPPLALRIRRRGRRHENGKKEFTLAPRKWVDHKGTRFYNGDRVVVIKRWLHRVDEDRSGLTFKEWDPKEDADPMQPPVAMIANSSELRAAGFKLQKLLPPELEQAARGGMRKRGAGLRQLEGMGPARWRLEQDEDNDFRSRCE